MIELMAQVNDNSDNDFGGWVWIIVGILAILALAIWILRNLR